MRIVSALNFSLWALLGLRAFGDTGVVGDDGIGSVRDKLNLD